MSVTESLIDDSLRHRLEDVVSLCDASLRRTVEAWPPELLFFFRVLFLLRALCCGLNVRVPYLRVLAPYARLALLKLRENIFLISFLSLFRFFFRWIRMVKHNGTNSWYDLLLPNPAHVPCYREREK